MYSYRSVEALETDSQDSGNHTCRPTNLGAAVTSSPPHKKGLVSLYHVGLKILGAVSTDACWSQPVSSST